ncbi:MAG: hypothetical protein H0X29_08260 [Parachlamydiaceae bacterium]|nr:hypothetical protein [Parachlamydiaceae bacterium]
MQVSIPIPGYAANDCLYRFANWGDEKIKKNLGDAPAKPNDANEKYNHGSIFKADIKHYINTSFYRLKETPISLVQSITNIVASPFAVIGELSLYCKKSINASSCLKNICCVPYHIIDHTFCSILYVGKAVNEIVSAASIGVGFLTWHGGERLVRAIKGPADTVLSDRHEIRDIVYRSIGITILAAAAVFIPVPPIQMIALPIILGSIYGILNNQFTVRECPEYYTMGHYYDGTDLKGHAIKTNNVIIKPIVTGCYASTTVAKLAGVIVAAAGRLPYTAAALPVPYAAMMIGGISLVSLVAAHICSKLKKKSIQTQLDEYAALTGMQWSDNYRDMKWSDLIEARQKDIEARREEFASDIHLLEKFNNTLQDLTKSIESNILNSDMPIKHIVGWQANNTRNSTGYLFAGGGTLAIAISTVFLRIFAL